MSKQNSKPEAAQVNHTEETLSALVADAKRQVKENVKAYKALSKMKKSPAIEAAIKEVTDANTAIVSVIGQKVQQYLVGIIKDAMKD